MDELIFKYDEDKDYCARARLDEDDIGILFEYCKLNRENIYSVIEYVYLYDKDLPKLVIFLLEYINKKKLLD